MKLKLSELKTIIDDLEELYAGYEYGTGTSVVIEYDMVQNKEKQLKVALDSITKNGFVNDIGLPYGFNCY